MWTSIDARKRGVEHHPLSVVGPPRNEPGWIRVTSNRSRTMGLLPYPAWEMMAGRSNNQAAQSYHQQQRLLAHGTHGRFWYRGYVAITSKGCGGQSVASQAQKSVDVTEPSGTNPGCPRGRSLAQMPQSASYGLARQFLQNASKWRIELRDSAISCAEVLSMHVRRRQAPREFTLT